MNKANLSKNRLKELAALKQKKQRLEQGLLIVEGLRTLQQIRDYGILPREQYLGAESKAVWDNVPTFELTAQDFGRLCDSEHPQGVAALFALPQPRQVEFHTAFYLDGISDPGNLGGIFRIASAFALDALLLSPDCVEISSPKVIRASLGSVFQVPFEVLDYSQLQAKKASLIATEMQAGARLAYFEPEPAENYIIIIGSEARGIAPQLKALAKESLQIQMSTQMESLNAAIAAGIIAHHLYSCKAL